MSVWVNFALEVILGRCSKFDRHRSITLTLKNSYELRLLLISLPKEVGKIQRLKNCCSRVSPLTESLCYSVKVNGLKLNYYQLLDGTKVLCISPILCNIHRSNNANI